MQQKYPHGIITKVKIKLPNHIITDAVQIAQMNNNVAAARKYRKTARENLRNETQQMLAQLQEILDKADDRAHQTEKSLNKTNILSPALQSERRGLDEEMAKICKELPTFDTEINAGKQPKFLEWVNNHNAIVDRLVGFGERVDAFLNKHNHAIDNPMTPHLKEVESYLSLPSPAKTSASKYGNTVQERMQALTRMQVQGKRITPAILEEVIGRRYSTSLTPEFDKITEKLHGNQLLERRFDNDAMAQNIFTFPNKAITEEAKQFLLSHPQIAHFKFKAQRVTDCSFLLIGFCAWNGSRPLEGESQVMRDLVAFLKPKFEAFVKESTKADEAQQIKEALQKWGKEITGEMQGNPEMLAKASGISKDLLVKHKDVVDALAKEQFTAKSKEDQRAEIMRRLEEARTKQKQEENAKLRELRKQAELETTPAPALGKNAQKKQQELLREEEAARKKEQEEAEQAKKKEAFFKEKEEAKNVPERSPSQDNDKKWAQSPVVNRSWVGLEDYTRPLPQHVDLQEEERNQLQVAHDHLASLQTLLKGVNNIDKEIAADALRYSVIKIADALKTLPVENWVRLFNTEDLKHLRNGLVHNFHVVKADDVISMAKLVDEKLRPCIKSTDGQLSFVVSGERMDIKRHPLFLACTNAELKVSDHLYMECFSETLKKLERVEKKFQDIIKQPVTDEVACLRGLLKNALVTNLAILGNCTGKLSSEIQEENKNFIKETGALRDIRRKADHSEFSRESDRTVLALAQNRATYNVLAEEVTLPAAPVSRLSMPARVEMVSGKTIG